MTNTKDIIDYISITQPQIQKKAELESERNAVLSTLNDKLNTLQKQGYLMPHEKDRILKEANANLSSIVKNLDIPMYNKPIVNSNPMKQSSTVDSFDIYLRS